MNDDERLKQTFDQLRRGDARRAPSFEAVRGKHARRRSPWAAVVPIGSLLAAAAVIVVWCNAPSSSPRDAAPVAVLAPPLGGEVAPALDEAPLDFLLEVPGLRGAPNFDTSLLRGSLR